MRAALGALALVAACNGDKTHDTSETGTPTTGPHFAVLGDDTTLPAAALLSVWGTSQDDVWIVGADDGSGPVVFHWDGATWSRLDTSAVPGDLWWVRGAPGSDLLWMSGADGRVLQYSRSAGTFTETVASDPVLKLFGVWPFADDDVYAVGADIQNSLDGVVVHWDGSAWTPVFTIPAVGGTRRGAYKVWGASPDDVWVVGTGALVAHWDGAAWTALTDMGYRTNTYFTVDGSSASDVVVVGGESNATVLAYDGSSWSDASPPPSDLVPLMFGVTVSESAGTAICGSFGSIWWRTDTGWTADPRPPATTRDLHSCWIDDQGAIWAVGDASNLDRGVALYGGDHVPPIP